MSVGERIKELRVKNNLTQKDLADKLMVSFQTVSKWENDTNEPDINTLMSLSKLFNVTVDSLLNNKVQPQEESKVEVAPVVININEEDEDEEDETEVVEKNDFDEEEALTDYKQRAEFNDDKKSKRNKYKQKKFEIKTSRSSSFKWAFGVAIAGFIISLVLLIIYRDRVNIGWVIGGPFIAFFVLMADIYCICNVEFIGDMFLEISSWSLKCPGVIFTFDLDGIMWLIGIKLLFGILGFLFGVAVFLFNVAITTLFSTFLFIPSVIKHEKAEDAM